VIVGLPLSRTLRFAANYLPGLELRGQETLLTVAVTPITHITGVVSPGMNSAIPAQEFRNCCRVSTASRQWINHKTGGIGAFLTGDNTPICVAFYRAN
jgi:hypothetical protein